MAKSNTKTFQVGIPVNVGLKVRNPSNQTLSYNVTGLPPGLSFDKKTGRISGTPNRAGKYRARFFATNADGTSQMDIDINIEGTSPVKP